MKCRNRFILFTLILGTIVMSCKSSSFPFSKKDFIAISRTYGYNEIKGIIGSPKFHKGIVIELKNDALIRSVSEGKVIDVCTDCKRGFGNYVLIEHNDSLRIKYYHLSEVYYKTGDIVDSNQIIGKSGNSGLMTVNGVGIRVWRNSTIIDPALILELPIN